MRVTYKPQSGPRPHRGETWYGIEGWSLTPTITVHEIAPLANPIGFAPWPKAPSAKAPRKRRKSR